MRDTERQLIRDLVAGDPAAADEFVNTWDPRIVGWIRQRCWPSSVDDFAQEVWWHLVDDDFRRLLKWKGLYDDAAWHPYSLQAFLKQLTVNKLHDLQQAERHYRLSGRDPFDIVDLDGPVGSDPSTEAERDRLTFALADCMRHFKPKDHRLIEMWWEGHADARVASALDTNPNNIQQRRFYLFKQLRACLAENLPEYFRHVQ